MTTIIIITAIWVICSVLAYGQLKATGEGKFTNKWDWIWWTVTSPVTVVACTIVFFAYLDGTPFLQFRSNESITQRKQLHEASLSPTYDFENKAHKPYSWS